jgi:glutamate 5-kinase
MPRLGDKSRHRRHDYKLDAAEIATKAGVNMIIANGEDPMVILDILKGKDFGTLFKAK